MAQPVCPINFPECKISMLDSYQGCKVSSTASSVFMDFSEIFSVSDLLKPWLVQNRLMYESENLKFENNRSDQEEFTELSIVPSNETVSADELILSSTSRFQTMQNLYSHPGTSPPESFVYSQPSPGCLSEQVSGSPTITRLFLFKGEIETRARKLQHSVMENSIIDILRRAF